MKWTRQMKIKLPRMGGNCWDCNVCGEPASSRCSSCLSVAYCSREHQKCDWTNHKPNCLSYEIKNDAVIGRCIVAKRLIKKDELVLKEKPLVIGPSGTTGPVCLGCHNNLQPESCHPCQNCGWPLCSERCMHSPNHEPECKWAEEKRKEKVRITQFICPHPTYACITPLRLLYKCKKNPSVGDEVSALESHCKDRMTDGKYEEDRFAVAKLLKRFYKLEEFSEEEIIRICGVLQINGHEVPLSEPGHIALFLKCSMFEHNCIPNCSKSFTEDGGVVIRAVMDIRPGEHLNISYTDPVWNTPSRLKHLRLSKYFSCSCQRCSDPSEFGTNFSGISCSAPNCKGVVLPETFLEECDNWKCSSCLKPVPSSTVLSVQIQVADGMGKVNKSSIMSHINFIEKFKSKVPQNFCHLVEVKLTLAQIIGQTSEKGLRAVDKNNLDLKEQLCRELLDLSGKLFRAECRILGVLHFELHAAIAEKTRRAIDSKSINTNEMQMKLMESKAQLEKVISYLKYEPETLPEGKIYKQAMSNLKELNNLYKSMKTKIL
ncbi:protein msta-like isoform X1 [Cimex lectularius]|uniref:Uncharacterized protein n=2 Tax=Cimex lectularius TaxID=79782 RepID=A0A8I6R6W2_CIMLE|nr:protein msta-like isoform X1 [Cimex lectularius]